MSTKKIAQNTAIQIVGKVLSTIFGLLSIGLMTRYLGTEQFGWYITAISVLQFAGILIDFGMTPVTAQMLSEPKYQKQELFANLFTYRTASAAIFFVLVPLAAMFMPYPTMVKQAIALLSVSFFAIAMNQVFVGYHQKMLTMHIQVLGDLVGRITLLAGLYALISKSAGFLPIMAAVGASSIAYTAVMYFFTKQTTPVSFVYSKEIWIDITKKMWPIAISILFNVVYLRGDVILLSMFSTQVDVGLYGAAYRVIDILGQTAMMMMGVVMPLLTFHWSRNMMSEFTKQYQQAFDMMMLFALPVTAGTIFLAEPIMTIVAGDAFLPSANALKVLAIAVFGVYVGAVFGHTAVAIDKQKQTIWIYGTNAVLSLGLYLYAIPKYGMMGAAWTTVFSELYAGVMLFFVISTYTKHRLSGKTFMKLAFSTALMVLAMYPIMHLHITVVVLIAILVYGVSVIATDAISLSSIRQIMKK